MVVPPSPKFQLYDVAFVVALALNVQILKGQTMVKLATGAVGGDGGGTVTVTDEVLLLVPFASATVSVTEYVPPVAYVCELVTPVPEPPSPKFQLYVAVESAVLPLLLTLQVSPEQPDVKFATGGAGGGPAEMNAEYSNVFVVPAGTDVVLAFDVSAASTCAGVAVGFRLEIQRDRAGHVRRGHRRPADRIRRCRASDPGRGDVHARRIDVYAASPIREIGEAVSGIRGAHRDGARGTRRWRPRHSPANKCMHPPRCCPPQPRTPRLPRPSSAPPS